MLFQNNNNSFAKWKELYSLKKKIEKRKKKDKDAGCLLRLYIKLDFQYFTNKLKVKPGWIN